MKIKRPLRTFTADTPDNTALTLPELIHHTGEGDRGLRSKLKAGQFKGAYRTSGGTGEWRIPLHSLRKYQDNRSITKTETVTE